MGRLLILDTTVLIDVERGTIRLHDVQRPDDDVAIAGISAAELLAGVELAAPPFQAGRRASVDELLCRVRVIDYDLAVARVHGQLLAHVSRTGTRRGAHDLIVAATAVATNRTLVAGDQRARFDDLPGLLVDVPR